ncbi:hypothetical protein EG329_013135 [Mollisiaceae sp. DMI_Dod_QoI]|nr:hypothetical protein EG329_013135 [Helotiales sp. DMI_Dod_QoI]
MSTKRKLPQKLGQPVVKQTAKVPGKGNLDESTTVVSSGGDAIKSKSNGTQESIEISSDEEEVEQEDDSDAESAEEEQSEAEADVPMEDAEETVNGVIPDDGNEEVGEPSFGDLVRANASEPIDVAGAFEDPAHATSYPKNPQIQAPSGASLGTVLTQALKTNDVSLLESCLHTTDVNTIRATIQRLESPLAGTLLQKLAERLHRRPGRAGSLMVWVQWTLVTHGGYLATQRDLMKKLAELNKVIDERAKGLQSLLSLKGKLDMLEAQIELRRSMQNQRRRIDEDEDDEGVIYVEGQESEEEVESGAAKPQRLARNGDLEDISDAESEVSEDMPLTNGVIADSEEEEEDSSDEDDLIDDAAEETDVDTGDEDEVDHDDQDSQGDDDESDDGLQASRPTKMPKTSGLFSKKR